MGCQFPGRRHEQEKRRRVLSMAIDAPKNVYAFFVFIKSPYSEFY